MTIPDPVPTIQPCPLFRQQLKEALLAAHRQQTAQRRLGSSPQPQRPFWQWMATLPVLLGIATLVWRYRQRTPSPTAKAV